jgi:hypothetical protein
MLVLLVGRAWNVSAIRSHFTTLRDGNILHWLTLWVRDRSRILNFADNIHAIDDPSEDDMLAVEMWSAAISRDDEELAAIGIWT